LKRTPEISACFGGMEFLACLVTLLGGKLVKNMNKEEGSKPLLPITANNSFPFYSPQ
jgi:hypothetical protein